MYVITQYMYVYVLYRVEHHVCIYVTRFVKRSHIHTQFQVSLFTTIRQIQQLTNSSCLYQCQRFNGLLLLRPHSWTCLASIGAQLVYKQLQLAQPGRQPTGNHHKSPWLVRLGIDVAIFCDMWS